MPARMQPRPAPNYDWDADGGTSRQGSGMYILNSGVEAQVRKPSWYGTETVFRPYPCVSFSNPDTAFEPYRITNGDRNRWSDWVRRYCCAWGVGSPATTFLIKKQHNLYDPWRSPLGILWRAIESACKKGAGRPEWYPLREAASGKGRSLKGPSECYLMQGALLQHDKTIYFGKDGPMLGWGKRPTMILACSADAGKQLTDLLAQEKPDYKGPPDDFEARYVHGDPVSPLFGRFFHFWERGSNARSPGRKYESNPTQPVRQANWEDQGNDGEVTGGGGKKAFEPKGFDIEIASSYLSPNGKMPASFNKFGEQQIRDHWQHWDDILFLPDEREQAHLLFTCFPASACIYAFEGHNKDWIPEDAYKQARNSTSSPTGGVVPGLAPGQEPPDAPMPDGFGAPDPTPSVSTGFARSTPSVQNDGPSFGDGEPVETPDSEPATAEDSTVPSGSIPDDPVSGGSPAVEAPPVVPTAPAKGGAGNAERTKASIAQLASLRNKVK